jgi:pimeloyl-ACP methyl ester carboxylesterase
MDDIHAKSLRAATGVRSAAQARGSSKTGSCTVDGCRIAWEQASTPARSRQSVVCLHAAGSGSREFRPLLDRLPTGANLICFDWPGHGRSEQPPGETQLTVETAAAILQNFLQQLGIENPILLGNDFGAAVAIRFAADNPGSVAGLILSQPGGLVAPSEASPFSQSGKRGIHRLLQRAVQFAPASTLAGPAAAAAKRQILRLAALRTAMLPARAAAKSSLDRSSASLRTALGTLACPALFALSRNNREYSLRKYLALLDPSLAWAPQHQFTVFAGAFQPLWDEPERFAQAVTGFVQAQVPLESHTHAWLISAVDYPTRNMNTWKCVHPECGQERVLPVGRNANESARR